MLLKNAVVYNEVFRACQANVTVEGSRIRAVDDTPSAAKSWI